jgi:hypothetical protein
MGVTDTRLCWLIDWVGRMRAHPATPAQSQLEEGLRDLQACLHELAGDRAALAYMREFEVKRKLGRPA